MFYPDVPLQISWLKIVFTALIAVEPSADMILDVMSPHASLIMECLATVRTVVTPQVWENSFFVIY